MLKIPTNSPKKSQLVTTIVGVALAILGYYFPALIPAIAPLGKLLWAGGLFTAGAGAVQVVDRDDT